MNKPSLVAVCAAVCCLSGCSLFTGEPEQNVLSQQEEVNGWLLLWDGDVPTNSWVGVSAGCSNFTARGWSVTNGALVASAGADAIRTAASYKDFDFKADYRLAPGASGRILYFHNAESDADSAFAYALAPLPPEAKDPLAWQTARIVVRRKSITHWLDGRIVGRKTRDDVDVEGRIVLVPDDGQIEFRNVKIRPFGRW